MRKDVGKVSWENHTKTVEEKTQLIAQHSVQLKTQQGDPSFQNQVLLMMGGETEFQPHLFKGRPLGS